MSNSDEIRKRIDHDQKRFQILCKQGLELKEKVQVKKITRLGKREDKNRPMRVFTANPEQASLLLRSAQILKEKEKFKNIVISSDRTPLERAERKRLQELKEMKQEESDRLREQVTWTIKKGRVVKEKKVKPGATEEGYEEEEDLEQDMFWG